ncbi:MAG: glutamine--fructose-6-phosphate transaminase (isomerizing) [Candidatus Aenigmarchaeota archaeon]|nr:glutamine--fructose-6-phosphate transaminase (isomerizing) [Candidatus Aenigmarchaeota archaeon]
MCGIFGYFGFDSTEKTLEALKFLEYRGYDSAGFACLNSSSLYVSKKTGAPSEISWSAPSSYISIGHTRWATHGGVTYQNAHPHTDCYNRIAVVHNGTLENYKELRRYLELKGHVFSSQTDTEVIPHLIEDNVLSGLSMKDAVMKSLNQIIGSYAIAVLSVFEPNKIIVARNSNPIFIGIDDLSRCVCSDIPTLTLYSQKMIPLEPYEIACVGDEIEIYNLNNGNKVERKYIPINSIKNKIFLDGYRTYTEKEIFEQPNSLANLLSIEENEVMPIVDYIINSKRIYIVGAGTSYNAGLIGSYILREAGISSEAIQSQEFPYKSIVDENTLCIFLSQSGTTADTNNAIIHSFNARKIGIVNVVGSEMERLVDHVAYTRAGPEIGVASTKNFLNQVYLLNYVFLKICEKNGIDVSQVKKDFYDMSRHVEKILQNGINSEIIHELTKNNPIFLGSGINYPVALESALKFKELTYMDAVGYSSGELKHGPLATVFHGRNVVSINPNGNRTTKINLEESKARGAIIINIGSNEEIYDFCIKVPNVSYTLTPIVSIIPSQLMSLRVAEKLNREIDKPRNLAKSVTVE